MQKGINAGNEIHRKGGMQQCWKTGKEGCSNVGRLDRRDAAMLEDWKEGGRRFLAEISLFG